MMRRSRISIKPNFKPGSRTGTEGEQASQMATIADDTLKAEELAKPTQSHQQSATLKEPSEDVGLKETPEMPPKMNQNDGAPSSGAAASSTAPHRRMRISAAPKLVGPKLSSTLRSARMPSSSPSPLPNEKHVHNSASETVSVISNILSKSGTPRKSTSTTELSSTMSQSSSPCIPSTSGLRKSLVSGKNAVQDSPPSPQPGQVPQQPPQEPELCECPSTADLSSADIKPSQSDKAGSSEMSEKSSDKDRILRALKLKELMKIERRKDIQKEKRRVGHKDYTAVDRSKMTMRDLIYYLPNTSPMRSSVECAENPEETIIPPSPKEQIKMAEKDEEEEEEEESENEEMLMPKVRVAEDGSIILDEDSLTVRVQRTSNTKVVENSATLFERGSTTTYTSFKKLNYVKSWSVRETDLFFLAISMVGTDFSLIGQLLTNRSRTAIKSKFKKEEKVNPWRVDKALRNKRPFDKEFFSYLLEKVLAKDKDKRKSIKLVLPRTRKPRRSNGKKSNKTFARDDEEENDDDDIIFHMDEEDLEDDEAVSVEKESEALSAVKEANSPAKKRRKRTIDISKSKDKDSSTEEQVKRKRQRKCSKTTKVHSKEDGEGEGNLNDESDSINVNKEDELKRSTSASKRRCKHSKGDEEKQNEKPAKRRKGKQIKKSLKVVCDQEESVSQHEESSIVDDEGSATKKKRKRAKNIDLDEDVPVTGKKNTKRKRALKSTVIVETAEEESSSANLQDTEQLNSPVTAEAGNNVSPKATKRSKKPVPKLATTRSKKRKVPETSAEIEKESQDEENHDSILTAADSPLEDERLQMQAVVLLEKTPPRQQYLLSPSKSKCKNNVLEPSMSSPSSSESSSTRQSRMQRAGRVKRDLSTSQKAEKRKRSIDQDEPVSTSPMVLFESITRESEDEEDDNSLNENLTDLSCLSDLDSHVFQRRPMVVLSREEVDMILHASEQSAEEDPSVSPLDLSLNTELSFPFQCSKLLEDNDDADVVDCMMEENEKSTNVGASCEPKNFEELELTESALAQPDLFILRDNSTPLKPEVCSQVALSKVTTSCSTGDVEPQVHPMPHEDVTVVAAVLEVPPPLVLLENVDPICMKLEAPVIQETIISDDATLGIPSVFSELMKESEKAMLPSLPKEKSELDSAEISVQSKLTSVGSGLGTQRPLQAAEEMEELKKSLEGPSQIVETLQDISESKKDTQESAMGKARTQSCAFGLEVAEDSKEEVSVQSSSASVSTEHGIRSTKRSRFLKPKPNLSQKSRVLQNQRQDLKTPSTLKLEISEPSPAEKPLYSPANAQYGSLENFSKQNLNKKEETSPSNTMDRIESESTKDLRDGSTAGPVQENITPVAPASAAEPHKASECCSSRCDVDMIPPCTSPQSSHNVENTGSGQMIVPSDDVDAPAEIVHLTDDVYNDEEPTFILTLYEIPVTEAYLPSSSKDPVMISGLPIVETKASFRFSDQAHGLPSTSEPSSITLSQDLEDIEQCEGVSHILLDDVFVPVSEEMGDSSCNGKAMNVECKLESIEDSTVSVTEDLVKNAKEQICNYLRFHESTLLDTKVEEGDACENLETGVLIKNPDSECKMQSEFAPLEDLSSSMNQSTSSGSNVSKCITLHQDSKDKDTDQCARVSHALLGDLFVPVSEEMQDNSSKNWAIAVECKLESNEASTVSVTEDLKENVKRQISDELTYQSIILDTKKDDSDACVNLESSIPLHLHPESECKNGSECVPLENLTSRDQSKPSGFNLSKCVTLHQDSKDNPTEQCERVSHMLLGDVFVPVSEELEDDLSKDRKIAVECKFESSKASTVNVTKDLAENVKEQISKVLTFQETIVLDTKDESNASVNVTHLEPHSECKKSSEIAPRENLSSRTQRTPSRLNTSKCVTLHQDSEDTEQCERISHVLLGDVFVPVLEERGDDLSRTKVENLPPVPNAPSSFDSTEESKCTTALSEKTKAPARRSERQKVKPQPKLVTRACAKVNLSKTDEVGKGPNQPTSSHVVLPASNEENLPGISNTTTEKSGKKMPSITGNKTSAIKGQGAKPNFTAEESPEMSQVDLEVMKTKPITTALHLSKEPKLDQEKSTNVMRDTTDKDEVASSAEDKPLSISTPSERENVQTCCETMHFNMLKRSGSGPSTVDSVETRIEARGVSHMVLPDVFVLVTDVLKDNSSNDWTVCIKSSPQRVSLSEKAGMHIQKKLKTEDVSQPYVEESTQSQSPLEETKTPVRKRAGKQEVKKTCTKNDSTKTKSCQQSPQATTSSAQLPTLPQKDNMLLLEEKLQKKHYIVPCSVKLSSLGTVDQSLSAFQLGDRRSIDKTTVMSSPTCHVNVMTVSGASSRPSLLGKATLEGPKIEKKSPTRRKGKKTESSPDKKHGHLKPVQTVSQTRQLNITDWVKKRSRQTETKQPAKSPPKQSSLKAKDVHQAEKTCSKSQHPESEEPEGSRRVPFLEETKEVNSASTEVKGLSEMVKELTEDPSVAQVKKSPPKRRAKLQVKPTLAERTCTESNTSTSNQQQPTRFTSPTRQRVQAAREKEESKTKNKPVKKVTNTSSVEAHLKCKGSPQITCGSLSPKSQEVWPKVVLPRVKLDTIEAGVCSASSTPTSSLARASQSASPPVTPPQMKKSLTQSSSPAANENLDDDPARVSQFFLSDIFTEVEEAE